VKEYFLFFAAVFTALVMSSCKAGPAGPQGVKGPDASDGLSVIMFQDGLYPTGAYTGCSDTRIWSGANADTNYGSYTYLELGSGGDGQKRGLIEFQVQGLPAGAAVKKAVITLYCGSVAVGSPEFVFYSVTQHNWAESQATWNSYSTGNLWTTPGGDYTASAISGFQEPVTGSYISWELDPAVVQSWFDDPAQTFGTALIVKDPGTPGDCVFASSNSGDLEQGPKLAVYY
jgi:hypothetical protein